MRMRFWSVPSLALAVVLGSGLAWAGPATDAVQAKQAALFQLIGQRQDAQTQDKIKALFDEWLDYGHLARASLGKHWDTLTADQQKEFGDLLEQLVRKSYRKNLSKVAGYDIRYTSEAAGDDGDFTVQMRAQSKTDASEPPIEIEFRVRQAASGWRLLDIAPEGASILKTYRNQFTKILGRDGYATLVAKMRAKLAKD